MTQHHLRSTERPPGGRPSSAPEEPQKPGFDSPNGRVGAARRVLWIVLGLNIGVAVLKSVAGAIAGSTALMADGVHSAFDGVSNLVGLVAIGIAQRPADEDHPYGHHKSEVVASLVIALMMLLATLEVARMAVSSLFGGSAPAIDGWILGAALVSLAISGAVSWWEHRSAVELNSEILEADASHTLSDALGTIAVVAGFGLVSLGIPWGDVAATVVVLVLLGAAVVRLVRRTVDVLMDLRRIEPSAIHDLASALPDVLSCHAVRSRGLPGHVQLDLHVTLSPATSLAEAGEVMLELKRLIRDRFPEVEDIVVQLEPHLPVHLPATKETGPTGVDPVSIVH